MARNFLQKLYHRDLKECYKRFSGVILDNVIGDIPDLQTYFEKIGKEINPETIILISYHNPSWEPILTLASKFGLRKKVGTQNWLDHDDLKNILNLSGFEVVSSEKRFFGITTITKARRINGDSILNSKKYSVSIVVPARNEAGNIEKIIPSIPKFGKWQEIIFVEGHSTDSTWEKVKAEKRKGENVKILRQKGEGKADAVWQGFEKAKGEILLIYDADRTVDANDLSKFYNALSSGLGKFANGSRMIYTWILGQGFRDTLCGTKALFRKDYLYMRKHNKKYFKMDPFGDFALIFGAIKNNFKVIEIPVRYKEREYGSTNISRFKHGLILLRMTVVAYREFKL